LAKAKFKYPAKKKSSLKKLSVTIGKNDGAIKSYLIIKYSRIYLFSSSLFLYYEMIPYSCLKYLNDLNNTIIHISCKPKLIKETFIHNSTI